MPIESHLHESTAEIVLQTWSVTRRYPINVDQDTETTMGLSNRLVKGVRQPILICGGSVISFGVYEALRLESR